MSFTKEFPFERARRIKKSETNLYRKAIGKKLGIKRKARPGRPQKMTSDKYIPISIRLHPKVIAWAKQQAKKQGIKYQSIINQVLLHVAA